MFIQCDADGLRLMPQDQRDKFAYIILAHDSFLPHSPVQSYAFYGRPEKADTFYNAHIAVACSQSQTARSLMSLSVHSSFSIAISDRARAARRTCASSDAQLCDPPEAQLRWGIETLH